MAKVKLLFSFLIVLTFLCPANAQEFVVRYHPVDFDTSVLKQLDLQTIFSNRIDAISYISQLTPSLNSKGYITASLDRVSSDSSGAEVDIFLGEKYQWAKVEAPEDAEYILDAIRWPRNNFSGPVDFKTLNELQQKILDHLEDNGHPFGKVYLDSITIQKNEVTALLKIDKGPLYKIDSIRVYGDAKVSNEFLQRYLQLPEGSIYNRKKLMAISARVAELPYLEEEKPFNLSMLGTGSVLNLYLKNKRSSQINVLIGLLPNSSQLAEDKKVLLTADANILLRNALGSGETIGFIWQQLQQKSPRLNLLFETPYVLRSSFGMRFSFDMFRKDSTYLNINMNLGTSYQIGDRKTATIFLQRFQTIVNSFNETQVIQTRRLPPQADVGSLNLGAGYGYNSTDYRFNPRKGSDLTINASAGTKKIKRNSQLLELKDPSDPGYDFSRLYDTVKLKAYQLRATAAVAHYIPMGKQGTFKLGLSSGIYESPSFFLNELFMIGGNRLLRGFDEESQYVSQYGIGTVEYRYLLGLNSAFFVFADGGWGKHVMEAKQHHGYFGTGAGLSFETKAGIFNLAWAVGQRDDTQINLRQSKLHFGFVSLF